MDSKRNPNLAAPMVSRMSFDPYESPVGDRGRIISTRKDRERDLLEHDCVPTSDTQPKEKRNVRKR